MNILKNTKGMATFTLALVMSIIIVIISISIALTSISSSQIRINQNKGSETSTNLDGCGEEALTQLSIDSAYSGGVVSVGNTSCNIIVAGYDPEDPEATDRTINITAVNEDYSLELEIGVSISPTFEITSWQIQNP